MAGTVPHAVVPGRLPGLPRAGWFWFAVTLTVFVAVSVPMSEAVGGLVSTAAAVVAIFVGIARNRPRPRLPWLLGAWGLLLMLLCFAGWILYPLFAGHPAPVPSVLNWISLAVYGMYAAGLAMFTRRVAGQSRSAGLLDAGLVALAAATVLWALIVDPYQHVSGMPADVLGIALAYPLAGLMLAVVLARLLFVAGTRTPSRLLLAISIGVLLFADIVNSTSIAHGNGMLGNVATNVAWDLSCVLLGTAALHPSMASTADPSRGDALSWPRVVVYLLLAVAGPLVNIGVLVFDFAPYHGVEDLVIPLAGSVGVSVLLVVRLAQIARLAGDRAVALDRQAADLEQSRQELVRVNQRVSAMFEFSPSGMVQLDPDGTVIAANPALAEFLGRPVDALIGAGIAGFVDDAPRFLTALRQVTAGSGRWRGELRFRDSAGNALWADYVMSPLRMPDGEHTALAVIADRTEHRRLEIEYRHAQKMEAIGRLAAGVAHELNTPIQFIGDNVVFLGESAATLLADDAPAATTLAAGELAYLRQEIPEAIRQTNEGVHRVATIVSALKSFAHRGSADHAPADLTQALRDTITIARGELRNVADTRVEITALPTIECAVGDLNQVILNLLVNAADAVAETQTPDKPGRITVRAWPEPGHVVIQVEDTGAGIPPEISEKVFEPFFTTKPVGRGTGQGLALARTIVVDGHHGSIDFTSKPGEGTTFTVRLPATKIAGR